VNRTSHNLVVIHIGCAAIYCFSLPLVFDHVQKVTVINDTLEYCAQGQPIVPSKSGGKPNDGYFGRWNVLNDLWIRVFYVWVEPGQQSTISIGFLKR
jgi:hypothetical protein